MTVFTSFSDLATVSFSNLVVSLLLSTTEDSFLVHSGTEDVLSFFPPIAPIAPKMKIITNMGNRHDPVLFFLPLLAMSVLHSFYPRLWAAVSTGLIPFRDQFVSVKVCVQAVCLIHLINALAVRIVELSCICITNILK